MSLQRYLGFLSDAARVADFRRAIERSVSAGDVVLDLGTGLGTYALFAAGRGARVIAVEPDPIIDLAQQLAAKNGMADRITFLHGRLEELDPPERASVLVFEDFSADLFDPATSALLEVARTRWLGPEARAIPRRVRLMAAPASCEAQHRELTSWRRERPFGLDTSPVAELLLNRMHRVSVDPAALLAEPEELGRLDPIGAGRQALNAEACWVATRSGELNGLLVWIDLELADGVVFSNQPSGGSRGWDQLFLPLGGPVSVAAGATIAARVATLGPARAGPQWWTWRVRVDDVDQEMNTFKGMPLSMQRLMQARLDRRPHLSTRGQLRMAALQLMDGSRTVEQLARELRARFPDRLATDADALRIVSLELDAVGETPTAGA